ncbi:MAG: hypothetical protein Hals2KO_30330 [Halioglobus sp.]
MIQNLTRCGVALGLVLGATAFAAAEAELELEPQQVASLTERVEARWETLEARDFDKTWEFQSPIYRASFPQHLYKYNYSYAVEWELTEINVVAYDAQAAVASVAVRVMSEPTKQTSVASRAIGALPVTFHEQWILIDGEWWHSANQ